MDNTTDLINATSNITDETVEDTGSECELFPDKPGYCEALVICKRVVCVISIIGSLFTLTIIILFKKYKEFTQRLIANLSFAAMLFSITLVMSDFSAPSMGICIFQGAWMTYQAWVMLLVSVTVLASLYVGITTKFDLKRHEKYLITTCWLLPLLLAGLPFSDDVYGPAGVWCWMKNEWGWRFGIWYIPKAITDVVFFVAIIRIWYVLLRQPGTSPAERRHIDDDIRTLRFYPVVYFLTFLMPTINRIVNAVQHSQGQQGYNFTLLLLHSISSPLFGVAVALTFALDATTRRLLRQKSVVEEIRNKWRASRRPRSYEPPRCAVKCDEEDNADNE